MLISWLSLRNLMIYALGIGVSMNLFKSCLGIGVRVSDLEAQPDAKPTSRLIFICRNVLDGFVFSLICWFNQAGFSSSVSSWAQNQTIKSRKITPRSRKIQPRSRKIQPRSRKIIPPKVGVWLRPNAQSRKITPRSRKIQPRSRKIQPRSRKIQPQSRKIIPPSRPHYGLNPKP